MGDGVGGGVVGEFCHREQSGPLFRFVCGEQPQVCFQFLIYSFGLPVSLWMIGGGKGDIILERLGEFSSECQGKLGASIRDYFGVKAESRENMSENKLGNSSSVNVFSAGAINYPLHEPMVYHDHDKVESVGIRQPCDEVYRDGRKGDQGLHCQGGESGYHWVFTLAAWHTAHPVMYFWRKVDIPGHQ